MAKTPTKRSQKIDLLEKAFRLMRTAKSMADLYERHRETTSKYVHATSRGHEAAQIALALQLRPQDWVSPTTATTPFLLGIGMRPYELMLQLLAKKRIPFLEVVPTTATRASRTRTSPRSSINLLRRACRPSRQLDWPWAFNIANCKDLMFGRKEKRLSSCAPLAMLQ